MAYFGSRRPEWSGWHHWLVAAAAAITLTHAAMAQQETPPLRPPPQPRFALPKEPQLEPRAVELLQAMSARLAAAKAMSFTPVTTYESPARTGLPLAYPTISAVTVERPDKLRVITPADGPPSEFYYDGKTMVAFAPDADLVARADAPPTLDAMLQEVYA